MKKDPADMTATHSAFDRAGRVPMPASATHGSTTNLFALQKSRAMVGTIGIML
jgi:hypothetical protein